MITRRQYEILEMLNDSQKPIDIQYFTEYYQKGIRTVRYDISNLRKFLEDYSVEIKTTQNGEYFIPYSHRMSVSTLILSMNIVENNEKTDINKDYLLELLLYFSCHSRKMISAIQNELYISRTLALNWINEFNAANDELYQICSKPKHGYGLEGDELTIRISVANALQNMMKGYYTPDDWDHHFPPIINQFCSLFELMDINNQVKKANSLYQVWMNNESFNCLIGYLIITKIRSRTARDQKEKETVQVNPNVLAYAAYLLSQIACIEVDETEVALLIEALGSFNIYVNERYEYIEQLKTTIKAMISLLKQLPDKGKLSFNYEALDNDLLLHLQHYLKKNDQYAADETLLLENIKVKYPQYYRLSCLLAEVFADEFGEKLPHIEVLYIAIYLLKNTEHDLRTKNVLVVCSTGRGLSALLVTRIRRVFPELNIVAQMSFYHLESIKMEERIDFVISTIPIKQSIYPVLQISNVLGQEDIRKIKNYLDYTQEKKGESFLSDPYDLKQVILDQPADNASKYSKMISLIILTMLDYLSSLSSRYPVDANTLLGLTIHLVMAIPRWFEGGLHNKDTDEEYLAYYKDHRELIRKVDEFFKLVEESLMVTISYTERFSFIQYIIRRN